MKLILIGFFKKLTDTKTHQVIDDLNGDCPLWVIDIWKMIILLSDFLSLF